MKLPSRFWQVSGRQWHRTAASSSATGTATILRYTKTYLVHLQEEYILQHANCLPDDQSEFIHAPQLLLPNYGVGRLRRYNLDIDRMTIFNSEERRLEQWRFHPSDFAMRQAWNLRRFETLAICGMFFEIHVTLIDGVTGLSSTRFSSSLGGESGDCSRSACCLRWQEKQPTSDTSLPPMPEWRQHEVPSSLVKGASLSSSHCSSNVLSPKTKFGRCWSVSRWTISYDTDGTKSCGIWKVCIDTIST